jgi:protoporphyrinogen oxidase
MTDVVVLGSGMAAWGAFDRLTAEGITPTLYDKNPFPGGHTASFANDGFVFDDGPHISFTEIDEVQDLLAEAVDGEYEAREARVDNYYQGHWVKHPAIAYLHGLPTDLVTACLRDFAEAYHSPTPERFDTYYDWLLAAYGKTYADNFPARYGRKYHSVGPELMDTSWLGPRLYRADIEEVIAGAIAPVTEDKHYISRFRYPTRGGFAAYLDRFVQRSRPKLGHRAVAVDPVARTVTFDTGLVRRYDELVSSVPLPELIAMMPAPPDVQEAAGKLTCSKCVVVNVGVDREDLSPCHWRYIYDEELRSVRLSFPHMFGPSTVPPGHGAVQVEVYYSDKYKPLRHRPEDEIAPVIDELRLLGIIRAEDRVVFSEARQIDYANVIFDLDSGPSSRLVHEYLDDVGVGYCGRYGDWAYIWTDQSYLSGQRSAQRMLDRLASV